VYIANQILKGQIYKYFIDRYNLRVDSVVYPKISYRDKNNPTKLVTYNNKSILLKWDINGITREKILQLGHISVDKRDYWKRITKVKDNCHGGKSRDNIKDYDLLLNGRNENEVLPDVCPIDNNILLNYTGIDFSERGDSNFNVIKNTNKNDIEWSFASVDRIDSNKPYTYDNIEVVSHYYNAQVKNCASFDQISKLYHYQLKRRQLLGIS
jgi:hypothetical protein